MNLVDFDIIQRPVELESLREDSVMLMARLHQIDSDQVSAAYRFRNAFYIVLDAKHESLGFREWQAPRGIIASLAERRMRAQDDLDAARQLLGAYLYALTGRICGEGYCVRDLFATRRERDTHADIFRIALRQLGILWVA
jgi:hypothetical protein